MQMGYSIVDNTGTFTCGQQAFHIKSEW